MSSLSLAQSNSRPETTPNRAATSPRIALRSLSVAYGALTVIRDLDLAVGVGECMALLGPSGCGKTTTLNLMAGFAQPSGGDILIDGKSMAGVPPHQRNTTMVFQSYALFPHMTVEQNVAFGLEMRRMPKPVIAERVRQALDIVRLSGMGERLPRQISGGQQQRVALARALAVEPSVLLLDEPLSNLDAQLREEMRLELAEIQRRVAITTVFVTHDQADAMAIADRIAVMNAGRIEQIGSANDLYNDPKSLFVAGFIGRMNILEAKVLGNEAGTHVVQLSSGGVIKSSRAFIGRTGETAKLTVRPEHIRIVTPTDQPANMLTGTLERMTYLGDILDISVNVGGQAVRAILRGDAEVPSIGQPVQVGWDLHQCQVFAADQAAAEAA